MRIDGLLFIVVIMALVLSSGAYGESVAVGHGTSIAVSSDSSADGTLVADSSGAQSYVSSAGVVDVLDSGHYLENSLGDRVEIGATGTNIVGKDTYNNRFSWDSQDGNFVAAQQWIGPISADSFHAYAKASNPGGESAESSLDLTQASLNSYYNAACAGSAIAGFNQVVAMQQDINGANGNEILATTSAVDSVGDKAGASTKVTNGALNDYSVLAIGAEIPLTTGTLNAAGISVQGISVNGVSKPMSASVPGGSILHVVNTYDNTGESAWEGTGVSNGDLVGNSYAYSFGNLGAAIANQGVDLATGSIDLQSHAQNNGDAKERSNQDVTIHHGGADFEVRPGALQSTNLLTLATSDAVVIAPTLPSNINTAIMLEPMKGAFTYPNLAATDLGTDVYPDLVKKGYATLRYTDSGASIDKFQDLGKYNVVLIMSHMSAIGIELSTVNPNTNLLGGYFLPASQINYNAAHSNSLVVLAGCSSFGVVDDPNAKSLASAFSSASRRGGFPHDVNVAWNADYVSNFFNALSVDGTIASTANTYAYYATANKYGYSTGTYIWPLVFYGDDQFKL